MLILRISRGKHYKLYISSTPQPDERGFLSVVSHRSFSLRLKKMRSSFEGSKEAKILCLRPRKRTVVGSHPRSLLNWNSTGFAVLRHQFSDSLTGSEPPMPSSSYRRGEEHSQLFYLADQNSLPPDERGLFAIHRVDFGLLNLRLSTFDFQTFPSILVPQPQPQPQP